MERMTPTKKQETQPKQPLSTQKVAPERQSQQKMPRFDLLDDDDQRIVRSID